MVIMSFLMRRRLVTNEFNFRSPPLPNPPFPPHCLPTGCQVCCLPTYSRMALYRPMLYTSWGKTPASRIAPNLCGTVIGTQVLPRGADMPIISLATSGSRYMCEYSGHCQVGRPLSHDCVGCYMHISSHTYIYLLPSSVFFFFFFLSIPITQQVWFSQIFTQMDPSLPMWFTKSARTPVLSSPQRELETDSGMWAPGQMDTNTISLVLRGSRYFL